MSNVVAGIGRGQLKVLDQRVEKKRQIYNYYKDAFKDIKEIEFMPMNEWAYCNCWLTSIILKGKVTPLDIMIELEKENIESRPLWKPMHLCEFSQDLNAVNDYLVSNVSEKIKRIIVSYFNY